MEDIKVTLYDLPVTIKGFTTYCYDEGQVYYTVFINSRLSNEMQCATYGHEIEHIDCGDFESMLSADELESIRHTK